MWIASQLDDDEIPVRYQWIVETDDGAMTVGLTEGGIYLGLTQKDAEHLADVLNSYIDREEITQAMLPPPTEKVMN